MQTDSPFSNVLPGFPGHTFNLSDIEMTRFNETSAAAIVGAVYGVRVSTIQARDEVLSVARKSAKRSLDVIGERLRARLETESGLDISALADVARSCWL